MADTKQTALYDEHAAAGGKLVAFAGWSLPVDYGSQIREHQAVREGVGMFDVSHMTIIDVAGAGALPWLQHLIANDVGRLDIHAALYGALLNAHGGVLDDLIVYRTGADAYRCVTNAGTRDAVLQHLNAHPGNDVTWAEQALSMIAVQGPRARETFCAVTGDDQAQATKPFKAFAIDAPGGSRWLVGRTGYTGEDGVEVMLPDDDAVTLWRALAGAGVQPAGLGARDTLRLEAGLNLYGQDLDAGTSPLASNIGWTIAWEPAGRNFIGRSAIEGERHTCPHKLTGLLLNDKGVLRHGQAVSTNAGPGIVTSGSFAPTLQRSIALARVPAEAEGACEVTIRDKPKAATIVTPPFVRNGNIRIDLTP